MLSSSKQSVDTTQSQCNPPLTHIIALAENTFAQLEKVISLNIAVSTASMQESHHAFRKLLTATTPQDFLSIAIGQLESNLHSIRSYSHNLLELPGEIKIKPEQNITPTLLLHAEVETETEAVAEHEINPPTEPAAPEPMPPVKPALETKTEAIPETAPHIVPTASDHAAKARQAPKITRPAKNKAGHKKK